MGSLSMERKHIDNDEIPVGISYYDKGYNLQLRLQAKSKKVKKKAKKKIKVSKRRNRA